MAYISSKTLEKLLNSKELKKHKEINANYSIFTSDTGEKLIQINTYGSDNREIKGKLSQTIQFNEQVLKRFINDMDLSMN